MKFLGEKGKSFSVFQLLIAAIVAIVILIILLSILGIIPPIFPNDPTTSAGNGLAEAYNNQFRQVKTQKSTFSKNYTLAKKAIIEKAKVGLSDDQVCLSLGNFRGGNGEGTSGFTGSNEAITYNGSGSKDVTFSALCAPVPELKKMVGNREGSTYKDIEESWLENCQCVTDTGFGDQVCCLVALRYPS